MSPKRPIKPIIGTAENIPTIRDTSPQVLPGSRLTAGFASANQPSFPASASTSHLPEARPLSVEIMDLPGATQIHSVTRERTLDSFRVSTALVDRLPLPDLQSGIRSAGRYQYADLLDGGTVLIGSNDQQQIRARLLNERDASGPLLQREGNTPFWRPVPPRPQVFPDLSELIVTRHRLPNDSLAGLADPCKSWGIERQHASSEDIRVDGHQYKVIPRGVPSDPIVYIKNPTHLIYDFDLLDQILRTAPTQQPRAAIQVPPANHWQIDPRPPFQRPLTEYVATYFPHLSATSLENVAFHQFLLANGSEIATGSGLTLLRQTFNDWQVGNRHPRPQLADPLLMLPTLPSSGEGVVRITDLPAAVPGGPLQRLDFDPLLFRPEWDYFTASQSAMDLKNLMAALLTRSGYTVFEPNPSTANPALVFQRVGHDYVFFLSLHRISGKKLNQTLNPDPEGNEVRMHIQVGSRAAEVVQAAHMANKVVWLRGGTQMLASGADTVFIVRDAHSRL